MKILSSATKVVLLLVTITLCVWLFMDKVDVQAFIWMVWLVFGFYFNSKPNMKEDFPKDL